MYFLEDLSYQLMNPGRYVVELDPKETIPALLIFPKTFPFLSPNKLPLLRLS